MGQTNGKEKVESGNQSVDGGFLIPQGVYSSVQDYDHTVVKTAIQSRKLAPFYTGLDDEEAYAQAPFNTECPICFLHYPSPLNNTRCCGQAICTECFVQIKRADPTAHTPPSSEPAACPYCQESNFGVIYKAPSPGVLSGEIQREAGVAERADAAREQAEGIAEGSHVSGNKRKSFSHQSPDVTTIDEIRPDWETKLAAAEAATTRRANRRIIMRQVGDRLIPVGVSSSRLGSELPAGSTAGPGGAIILGENTRWGAGLLSSVAGGGRGDRRSNRRDLSQLLQGLGDGSTDMEEIMMMEAMRLSLLEHEEQQRREAQAQSQSRQGGDENSSTAIATSRHSDEELSIPATVTAATTSQAQSAPTISSSSSSLQQQQQNQHTKPPHPRTSSLANEAAPVMAPSSRRSLTHQELGISSSMMAELSELVDGGLGDFDLQSAPSHPAANTTPAATQSILQAPTTVAATSSSSGSPRPSTATPIGSPSRIGTNPNNPFRRMGGGSNTTSPSHSRQSSTLYTSWTGATEGPSPGTGQ
ncbi:hypothetical protein CBS101457_004342 [Exobasidium rhododendri]|nr:hypothetical protein CBS101457_004342 [Exobasidium rhododendri]